MSYVYLLASLLLLIAVHTLARKYWQRYRKPFLANLADPASYCSMA